jgi:hypothetical protein
VRHGDGTKDRASLKHTDRVRAELEAKARLQRLAELRNAGKFSGLTLGQLEVLYLTNRRSLLSENRNRTIKGMLPLLLAHFGRDFILADLSQHEGDAYVAARLAGASSRRDTGEGARRASGHDSQRAAPACGDLHVGTRTSSRRPAASGGSTRSRVWCCQPRKTCGVRSRPKSATKRC